MSADQQRAWTPIIIVVLAGSIATALVPLTVPILQPIAREFAIPPSRLGWLVSFPTLVCALGALGFGVIVDRVGDVRLLLIGMLLVILGDGGVALAAGPDWLFAARLFQGVGYVSITVAAPSFIQRTTSGDRRRAAMAFWAAHTPIGFAAAVFAGAQLIAAGLSWRFSFLGHAATALLVGAAVLGLRRVRSEVDFRRSAGTMRVLTSLRPYAVATGALATGALQVGLMVVVPALMTGRFGLTGPEAGLVVVFAMVANFAGSLVIVGTDVRRRPDIALPITATCSALFAWLVLSGASGGTAGTVAATMLFTASVGAANSLVWSLIPSAVPAPEAAGATAGLITQGSFLGVLLSPPTFFWAQHQSGAIIGVLTALLAGLTIVALFANKGEPAAAH